MRVLNRRAIQSEIRRITLNAHKPSKTKGKHSGQVYALFSDSEMARRLGVTVDTIHKMSQEGDLSCVGVYVGNSLKLLYLLPRYAIHNRKDRKNLA